MNFNEEKIKAIIEAMIFVSPEPVSVRQILTKIKTVLKKDADSLLLESDEILQNSEEPVKSLQDETEQNIENSELKDDNQNNAEEENSEDGFELTHRHIKCWLKEIAENFAATNHGFELVSVAKGYQFRTKYDVSLYLRSEKKSLPSRLSVSAMETLAIVAYEQPVARSKIDDIRGVDSGGVLKTLLEKEFIRIIGRADEPGQPLLYGSTNKFLEVFHLKNLKELPSLHEIQEFNVSEDDEQDEEMRYFDSEAEIEQRMHELSEAEEELMRDLDESLQQVKETEKEIKMFDQNKSSDQTEEVAINSGEA